MSTPYPKDIGSLLDLIVGWNYDIEITKYCQIASFCIVLFDHLATLDEEVELIWQSSWSLGKIIFIINRYYTLLSFIINSYGFFSPDITDTVSLHFYKWQGWTGLIACILAEIVLQMRLYALYLLNKRVLVAMVTLFVMSVSASAYVLVWAFAGIKATANPIPGTVFCYTPGIPDSFYAFWIPMIAFETFLCCLALVRGFQAFRKEGSLFQSGRKLVGILVRDSMFYYFVMFATYFTNFAIWAFARHSIMEAPVAFCTALSCVLSNRLVLNVRRVNRDHNLLEQGGQDPKNGARARQRGSTTWGHQASQFEGLDQIDSKVDTEGIESARAATTDHGGRRCQPHVRREKGSIDTISTDQHIEGDGFDVDYYYVAEVTEKYLPSETTLVELEMVDQLHSMRAETGHSDIGHGHGHNFFSL